MTKRTSTRSLTLQSFWSVPFLLLFTLASGAANFCNDALLVKIDLPQTALQAKIAVGTKAVLEHASLDAPTEMIFLGKLVDQSGLNENFGFYDPATKTVHYVEATKTKFQITDGTEIGAKDFKLIVHNENQVGGTCGAYSLFHCLRQVSYFEAAPEALKNSFATESSRLRTVMQAVNEIYMNPAQDFEAVIPVMAKSRGLEVYPILNGSPQEFKQSVENEIKKGWPVLMSYSIEPEMMNQPVTVLLHDGKEITTGSPLLWEPFVPGNFFKRRPQKGHSVVLLAEFEAEGKSYFLVSDPNWGYPRLWPADFLLRQGSANMKGWVLWFNDAAKTTGG